MIGTLAGLLVDHWRLALGATALGAALALAYLTTEYLIVPACRLRAARLRGPDAAQALLARSFGEREGLVEDDGISGFLEYVRDLPPPTKVVALCTHPPSRTPCR